MSEEEIGGCLGGIVIILFVICDMALLITLLIALWKYILG